MIIKTLKAFVISLVAVFVATTAVNAQTTGNALLEVVIPSDGQTIYGNKVPILFNVENFEIVDFNQNTTPAAGKGHIHIWLDDTNPTPESAVKIIEDNYTFSDVPYGEHSLVAELVGNTHKPLTPPQKVTVKFTNSEVATSEAAAASGFDKKTALVILVVVALVIVAAWWYTKEEDEEELENPPTGGKPKKTTKKSSRAKQRK